MPASGLLTKKLGPLPRWAWFALAVVAYFAYSRYKAGSTQSLSAQASPVATPSTSVSGQSDLSSLGVPASAGASSPGATGSDQATSDLLSAYGASQGNLLNALLTTQGNLVALAQTQAQNLGPGMSTGGGGGPAPAPTNMVVAPQPGGANAPIMAHVSSPFGGVTSTKKLKSGATLTTYASGRQVEQAPGKTAYVVHK